MPRACHDGKRKVEVDGKDRVLFSEIKSFVCGHTQPSIWSVTISLWRQSGDPCPCGHGTSAQKL